MELKEILKQHGKSYTKEREVIFEEIKKLHHFSYQDLEKKLENIGRASIFRTLSLFNEVGIIEIIDNDNGALIYEIMNDKNHHEHMKCNDCGELYEFDDSEIHGLLEKISKMKNFKLKSHNITLKGSCNNCIDK